MASDGDLRYHFTNARIERFSHAAWEPYALPAGKEAVWVLNTRFAGAHPLHLRLVPVDGMRRRSFLAVVPTELSDGEIIDLLCDKDPTLREDIAREKERQAAERLAEQEAREARDTARAAAREAREAREERRDAVYASGAEHARDLGNPERCSSMERSAQYGWRARRDAEPLAHILSARMEAVERATAAFRSGVGQFQKLVGGSEVMDEIALHVATDRVVDAAYQFLVFQETDGFRDRPDYDRCALMEAALVLCGIHP